MSYEPKSRSHPGEIINDYLNSLERDVEWLAQAADLETEVVVRICNNKSSITEEIAKAIAGPLGRPAKFWLNLQINYDKK